MVKFFMAAAAAAMAILSPQASHAAGFPEKPVRIVVPYPAGGSTDVLMRVMAPVLGKKWGVPVVIEDRPGASSIIGANIVAQAPADGYTLVIVANAFSVNPSLHDKMPYNTLKDFTPLTQLTFTPNVLIANTGEKFKTMQQMVDVAKTKELSSGSIGNGTAAHLALEKLKTLSGIKVLHVPFQGSAPGITALMGQQTNLLVAPLPDVLPYVRSGKVLALAIGSPARVAQMPDTPTFKETGFDFQSGAWFGMLAPAGLDKQIAGKLSADFIEALGDPSVKDKLDLLGLTAVGSSSEDFKKLIVDEVKNNGDIVRQAGIRVD
ncbi:tripartite tricarboxylate transporter substrate binding protein [Bordetella sp. N]|uniref:Bug family tripartite tricarboxylate transporter substrate binding protein n=1 Tax=Bordetella sp. N TaxID=1746199 RepID=UPI00070A83D8|nr:tripartite tricarboxylate transporter substrate binding protein [Bordetella sp. N]ALM86060.1 hypothetical protein ASB57_26675 [Bordetella sp. N]